MPASRTPEGCPSHCNICGAENEIDFSSVGGDAPCPNCGHLLQRTAQFADRIRIVIAEALGMDPELLAADQSLHELKVDSLDLVQVVMAVEEVFDIQFPDTWTESQDLESLETVGNLVRFFMGAIPDLQR